VEPVEPSDPSVHEEEFLGDSAHAPLDPGKLWATLERRIFATNEFFRLWVAQVITSIGNWLFFFAMIVTATRVGGDFASASVGFVVAARLVPGLLFSQVAGVLADRWDRRKLMVITDVCRALVVLTVPFIDHVWQLVVVSLVMELFTLLWIPAKEASVPNLVPKSHLTTANSLAVVATYGTIAVAAVILLGLAAGAARLEVFGWAEVLRIDETSLSFYVDAGTYLMSALLISTLAIRGPATSTSVDANKASVRESFSRLADGWRLILEDRIVRSVNVGLAAGLIGGGMVVPLGSEYAAEVLGAGERGYFGMVAGLGLGAAGGVVVVSMLQERLRKRAVFVTSLFATGVALLVAASLGSLTAVIIALVTMGFFAGPVYVVGFTLLHEQVQDEFRGRIFAALYALVQISALIALVIGPFFAEAAGGISSALLDGSVPIFGFAYALPGERLALWFGALIIIAASVLALVSLGMSSRASLKAVK